MDQIKFSKEYKKLHKQTSAILVAVFKRTIDDQHPWKELLDYDTIAEDNSRYDIGNGEWIQLVFVGNLGIPFCTIRSAYNQYGSKYDYYKGKLGHNFNIVRVGEAAINKDDANAGNN